MDGDDDDASEKMPTDQREINRLLFELVVTQMGIMNELVPRVEAIRSLQSVGGAEPVSDADFDQVVEAAKKRLGQGSTETIARVQWLVAALQLPKQ